MIQNLSFVFVLFCIIPTTQAFSSVKEIKRLCVSQTVHTYKCPSVNQAPHCVHSLPMKQENDELFELGEDDGSFSNISSENNDFDIGKIFGTGILMIFLALGSNFLDITSSLLSSINNNNLDLVVYKLGLDQFYAIDNLIRFTSPNGYSFRHPKDWETDKALSFATADKSNKIVGPEIAFGPISTKTNRKNKLENLSVIVSPIMDGFSIKRTLGEPLEAAEKLLSSTIGKTGSGKIVEIISAEEEIRNGQLAYSFNYLVKKNFNDPSPITQKIPDDFKQRSTSVIMERGGNKLYTFTLISPDVKWQNDMKFRQLFDDIGKSFQLE